VRQDELEHILRAACEVTREREVLVIGSQAILGSYSDDVLPEAATRSIEADVAFLDDPDESKSDAVDGAIGEESVFHTEFGVYGQGVGLTTAVLPEGWRQRLVRLAPIDRHGSIAWCLEPHDLVVAKLVAGREKDYEFAAALVRSSLVDMHVLKERTQMLPVVEAIRRRILAWLERLDAKR
jgi:hypothetical protein